MISRTTTIEARVARLEMTNGLLLLALLVALGLAVGNARGTEPGLRAGAVQLVDEAGGVAAELAIRDGNPGLYILDPDGRTRLALFHSAEATGLHVIDADEVTRVGVAQFAHGGGGLALHGPGSKGAAVLYYKDAGTLRFYDAEGNVTNAVAATTD